MTDELTKSDIEHLFHRLNEKLAARNVSGELYVVGGAVMCIVLDARPSTKDIDAIFAPTKEMREAAKEVAYENELPETWLNDAVKGFLSTESDFEPFLDLEHLKVYTASPPYLLAMKALAMRIGEEFQDENDLRYLLRYLNIETYEQAIAVITKFYDLKYLSQKTLYALEEILERFKPG